MLCPWEWEGGRNILGLSGWWIGLVETGTLRSGRTVRTFHVIRTKPVHRSTTCTACGGSTFAGDGREPLPKRADLFERETGEALARERHERKASGLPFAAKRVPGLKITDAPAFGHAVRWVIYRRRLVCSTCRHPTREKLPAYIDTGSAMTARCNVYARHQAAVRPYMDVAREIGVHDLQVRKLARRDYDPSNVARLQPDRAPKQDRVTPPRYLGIDEIAMVDREKADPPHFRAKRATFVDIEAGNVVDILRDDAPGSVTSWIESLTGGERSRIRAVVIDMNGSYRAVVEKALPRARLIVDRFHVETMAQKAVDRVRIDETKKAAGKALAKLKRQGRSPHQDKDVRAYARMLRAKAMPQTPEARHKLREYLAAHPRTCLAIEARQEFGLIYDTAKGSEEAMRRFLAWQQGLAPEVEYAFRDLVRNFSEHGRGIVAYFDLRITNGPTEAANAAMRKIIRGAPLIHLSTLREKVRARGRLKPIRRFFCDRCQERSPVEAEHHADLKGDLVCRWCRTGLPRKPKRKRVRWTVDDLWRMDDWDRLSLKRPLSRRRAKAQRGQQVAMLFDFAKPTAAPFDA